MVVIDTLARALGRADQSDLADMTVLVGDLQTLALEHDAAVLVIDHHRKPSGFVGDPIDDIVGSTAKSAVADAALGLFKEQGKAGAVLDCGPMPSAKIEIEAKGAGLSWDTMKRAKDKLDVVAHRDGKLGIWTWGLPARSAEQEEDA